MELPFDPGTSADILIWDRHRPSRTYGDVFDFEVGGHNGAEKGRIHVMVPFSERKNGPSYIGNALPAVQRFVCRQILKS